MCEQQTKIKQSLHAIDGNYDYKKLKKLHPNITKVEHEVLIKLSKSQSIVVVKSDETNQVVIMNKNNYIEKLMTSLGDAAKFKKLNKELTRTRENRFNAPLLKMKKEGKITDERYQLMRSTGAIPGKFYGLPKTHKKDNPLRPIISNRN